MSVVVDRPIVRVAEEFDKVQPFKMAASTLLVAAYVGSHAHGTTLPSADPNKIDDIDVMLVVMPPIGNFTGLTPFDHWSPDFIDGWIDVTACYSLHKFARLIQKGNPNVLGLLVTPPLQAHPIWDIWTTIKALFISQQTIHSFLGYASGQLARLGKPDSRGYMGRERQALFQKYGYDIKNAAHLVRLLHMGREMLEYGEINVDRRGRDAADLIDIKRGLWTLGQIQREAEKGFALLQDDTLLKHFPERVNARELDLLVQATVKAMWRD